MLRLGKCLSEFGNVEYVDLVAETSLGMCQSPKSGTLSESDCGSSGRRHHETMDGRATGFYSPGDVRIPDEQGRLAGIFQASSDSCQGSLRPGTSGFAGRGAGTFSGRRSVYRLRGISGENVEGQNDEWCAHQIRPGIRRFSPGQGDKK